MHRTKAKAQGQVVLGTVQQCTEVLTLLWLQGSAQCRKIVHLQACNVVICMSCNAD